jgi:hypothetical protein
MTPVFAYKPWMGRLAFFQPDLLAKQQTISKTLKNYCAS